MIFLPCNTFSLSRFNVTYKVLCRYPETDEAVLLNDKLKHLPITTYIFLIPHVIFYIFSSPNRVNAGHKNQIQLKTGPLDVEA